MRTKKLHFLALHQEIAVVSGVLESLLTGVSTAAVTDLFLWVLLALFGLACWCTRKSRAARFTAYAPTMLTTVGILGTFVGIVIGLLDFRPTDIDSSISRLLDGLKTAFITSLAGMFSSILFKGLTTTPILAPRGGASVSEAGPEEILSELCSHTEMLQLLPSLRDAVAGAEESSLAGQLKLMRTDFQDARRDERSRRTEFEESLWGRLDAVGEQLSKSATEQVIQALQQVISDFNQNLTEQFGENFKALDASVAKLVEWQDKYRAQLDQLHHLYEQSVEVAQDSQQAVTSIAESAQGIPPTMKHLETIVSTADRHIRELEAHLHAFADMRDRALQAIPDTQALVQEMADKMAASVDAASTQYGTLLAQAKQGMDDFTQRSEELAREAQHSSATLTESIREAAESTRVATTEAVDAVTAASGDMQRQIELAIGNSVEAHRNAAETMGMAFRDQLRDALSKTNEGINGSFNVFDEAMRDELERILREMGTNLGKISNKFVEDYQRLVSEMDRIVSSQPGYGPDTRQPLG